jgi:NADH-quinone oxidoreductase subunit M
MVLFTFIGSLFLLTGIFLLFLKIRSFNTFDIFYITQSEELNIIFSTFEKKLIWLLLFIGFAVKTPLYPFHIWLPEAHSEAPTTGSVMLAGVLLKMGTYGFLRFVIPLFPSILETFKTLVFSMCICGILLSSLAALAQIDIKKIIAYSSIGHMGLVIIGIYTLNMNGLLGASYMMLSHGLVSSALFFSIGLLYKIYGTRSIVYYNSIAHFMPRFSMCFFVFSLANMSFPGTAGFPGEILIFAAMMADNFFLSLLVAIGSIFGGVYSIWLLT